MAGKIIWFINQYAGSPIHGMEFRHFCLAKELVAQGHDVHIISGSYSHLYSNPPEISGEFTFEEIDKINYCWVKIPEYKKSISIKRILNMLVFAYKLKKLPLKNFKTPDAIIVSSPSLFPLVNGKKLAKIFAAKFIFEVKDIWPLTLQYLGNLNPFNPLIIFMQWYENFGYRNADKIISVLPGARLHMMKHGMMENKFMYVPNGIDVNENTNAEPLEKNTGLMIPENKFIVGYAGTVGRANALEFLIQTAHLVQVKKDIHFVIAGDGGEKKKLVASAENLNNITFINSVKKKQVAALLQRFDVCYIGWRKEKLYQFGISANKLFEYMYSGKPVIHSVDAFNDPIAESSCGISVAPENAGEIADAIFKLYNMSNEERNILGKNGKSFVLKNHSYKILAERLASIL